MNGTLFDVLFEDGTCAALFHGCPALSDFQFPDLASAEAAGRSLLDTVFVDGPAGPFDSRPDLTRGCSDPTLCQALIPYLPSVPNNHSGMNSFSAVGPGNFADPSQDRVGDGMFYAAVNYDTSGFGGEQLVFAVFSPAPPATVPEPPLFALFGIGILGCCFAARRGRTNVVTRPAPWPRVCSVGHPYASDAAFDHATLRSALA